MEDRKVIIAISYFSQKIYIIVFVVNAGSVSSWKVVIAVLFVTVFLLFPSLVFLFCATRFHWLRALLKTRFFLQWILLLIFIYFKFITWIGNR